MSCSTNSKRAALAALLLWWRSIRTVRLIDVDSRGHAVIQRLLIPAITCIDAGLALAFEVLAVVDNVWVRVASAFEVVLISLGSNDGKLPDPMTYQHLTRARKSVAHAKRVVWIAPGPQFPARAQVQAVAMTHGDVVYERPVEQLHADSVHFTKAGYQRIASVLGGV